MDWRGKVGSGDGQGGWYVVAYLYVRFFVCYFTGLVIYRIIIELFID